MSSPFSLRTFGSLRSLSDVDLSTAANDPRPSASCPARTNPQCIPANTPPVFRGLRPRIWPHLLRLVTNGNVGQAPSPPSSIFEICHELWIEGNQAGSISVLRGLLAHGAAEEFCQRGIEGGAGLLLDLLQGFVDREGCSFRFFGGQVVKRLGNADNASEQGRAFFS